MAITTVDVMRFTKHGICMAGVFGAGAGRDESYMDGHGFRLCFSGGLYFLLWSWAWALARLFSGSMGDSEWA
jgi:hypothetical protein